MPISEDLVESLKILGLSEYTAKVYGALVLHGVATATQIASTAGVPANKVYTTLRALADEGYIFEVEEKSKGSKGHPNRYKAYSPSVVLEKLGAKYEHACKVAETYLNPLFERGKKSYNQSFWTLQGDARVYGKIADMVESAKKELILATDTLFDLKVHSDIAEKLELVASRGVNVRVITSHEGIDDLGEKDVLSSLNQFCEVCVIDPFHSIFVVADEKQILFGSYALRGKNILDLTAIWSDNEFFTKLWADFARDLWKNSASPHPKVGDHICCIYDNKDEQFSTVLPFIQAGLENREKVVYIADENTKDEITHALLNVGIDVQKFISKGQLQLITKDEAYTKDGYFDPDKMISLLKENVDLAVNEGYKCLRMTGEMIWALKDLPGSEKLLEYEAKLNYLFTENPIIAICQYNQQKFSEEIIMDILRTHPIVISEKITYSNPYYISPDEFLKKFF